MSQEIKEHAVYTTTELRGLLKISSSTVKRLIKSGLLKTNKVGGQYRVLGKEILRLVSPQAEKRVTRSYLDIKNKIVNKINQWK